MEAQIRGALCGWSFAVRKLRPKYTVDFLAFQI